MEKLSNLIALANDELAGENYEEAERLATEALKEDRSLVDGWIIKAKVAYHLNRGLTASYNYLKNAFEVSKDEKDKKAVLDAFVYVSSKELKWSLSNTLEYVHDLENWERHSPYVDKFEKEGKEFLSIFKDEELTEKAFNKAANEYIKYAIDEINKKWDELCKDYYRNALSDFGASWEYDADKSVNNYRPSKYEFDRFVYGVFNLSAIASCCGFLSNEDSDLDAIIQLQQLAYTMINCALSAKGYAEKQHAFDVNDDDGNFLYTDYRLEWEVAIVVGDKLKNDFIEKQNKIRKSISIMRKNKETYAYNKKRREKDKYWAAHPEECAKLVAQKDATVARRKELQEAYDAKQSEIDEIDSEAYGGEEMSEMKGKIKELDKVKADHKHTFFLRFRERKQLKQKINEMQDEINMINFKRHGNMNRFNEEKQKRIDEKTIELERIASEIESCDKLIASIDDRL